MLINFRFDNYRSFYEEANLSMQTTVDSTLSEINTFTVNEKVMGKGDNELLKSAVIFGGNASGKSNIMKAFAYMVNFSVFLYCVILVVLHPYAFLSESPRYSKRLTRALYIVCTSTACECECEQACSGYRSCGKSSLLHPMYLQMIKIFSLTRRIEVDAGLMICRGQKNMKCMG